VQHAVVVGASGGVGKLVAEGLDAEGVLISTVGRRPSPHPGARHQRCEDLGGLDWTASYREAEHLAGVPIDAVVYVAGDAAFGRTRAVPVERARALFEANMWAPAAAALAADALWQAPRRGTFVSVSSISARRAVPFEAYYCASKAACARFLDALRLEHPDDRVVFASVYPGRLSTGFRAKADWYGAARDAAPTEGSDPRSVARAILDVLHRRRGGRVIGARERAIDLADRLSPALYDRLVLRRRVRKATRS
jgi:short-subunit dehydrogenase